MPDLQSTEDSAAPPAGRAPSSSGEDEEDREEAKKEGGKEGRNTAEMPVSPAGVGALSPCGPRRHYAVAGQQRHRRTREERDKHFSSPTSASTSSTSLFSLSSPFEVPEEGDSELPPRRFAEGLTEEMKANLLARGLVPCSLRDVLERRKKKWGKVQVLSTI